MKYAIVHIADIHYRKKEPEGASTIIKAFIDDIESQKTQLNLDGYTLFLSITGDIVFSGQDFDSYSSIHNEFHDELNKIGLTKDFRMMVPGNHDIDRSYIESNFDAHKEKIRNNIDNEHRFNNFVMQHNDSYLIFDNYFLFEEDFAGYGIDYSIAGKGWTINESLGVYCLNTALCSFGGVNNVLDRNNLAICTREIVKWCSENNTSTNILLMHHPLADLAKWSKDELKQIIEKHFVLCICGHNHEQDIFYNTISKKSLVCSAPQLFTNKNDSLGYAIILMNDNLIERIVYRQFIAGKFLNGQRFSGNDDGCVDIQSNYRKFLSILEGNLNGALAFFKGQPNIFIKPKVSSEREFNEEVNLVDEIITTPFNAIIVAHPQFGLTCLAHYLRLEAYKLHNFWIYIDAKHTKARNISSDISCQLNNFSQSSESIKCIIIDSWEGSNIDHRNILKFVVENYKDIPVILLANYSDCYYNSNVDFSKINIDLKILHLQALRRHKVREFVSKYIPNSENEDAIVTKIVKDLEVLNVHRTPLNCLTLLKVFERDFNQELINRTKLIKAVMFILFTDAESFIYSTDKPDVDDCEYILGRFCKSLIENHIRRFKYLTLTNELKQYCNEKLISVDVDVIINILEANNILLRCNNDELEFKHSYWIYYFAATYMKQDDNFTDYILNDNNYVNFPEIIEFYTGIDGRRSAAIKILTNDLRLLIKKVDDKIGIPQEFNPLNGIIWNPSEAAIDVIRKNISEKVIKSKLPTIIKDQHADLNYDSEAPYDQSINNFLNEYSVISLMQGVAASSRALRNSNYVEPELKRQMLQAILDGWEQISKVIIWLSPTLAHEGKAAYEGFGLILWGADINGGTPEERLTKIILANPYNVVRYVKDNLSSKKIGPLIYEKLDSNSSEIQDHFLGLFLIMERPTGWCEVLFDFMNKLHRNSYTIGDLNDIIADEIKHGFISKDDLTQLKRLQHIVIAKLDAAPKTKNKKVPKNINSNSNKLPRDVIIASSKKNSYK